MWCRVETKEQYDFLCKWADGLKRRWHSGARFIEIDMFIPCYLYNFEIGFRCKDQEEAVRWSIDTNVYSFEEYLKENNLTFISLEERIERIEKHLGL